MRLTPRDIEKLMLHQACVVAQKRYARGLKLNYPEAIALISGQLLELIRDGHSLSQLTQMGKNILGLDDVMPGVAEMISEVQVEGTLLDGTKLVSVHEPICQTGLSDKLALYGSGLTRAAEKIVTDNSMNVVPGEIETMEEDIDLNYNRDIMKIEVTNMGTRAVQVGSHCNFAEVNKALSFDRMKTLGYRLDIPAGTAVRFEPGETKNISMVLIGGEKKIYGGNSIVEGDFADNYTIIEKRMKEKGFIN